MTSTPAASQESELVVLSEPRDGVPPVTTTAEELADVVAAMEAGHGPVAVDAERASGHRYGQRAFLVQLRRDGAGTHLIDPIELPDLTRLDEALAPVEWVLHAASQDLPCLAELGLAPRQLFDTELSARLLGRTKVGLGAIIAEELGVELAKEHSAADWSRRPLPADWLRYAALDVELLVELRHRLADALGAAGKLDWARQEFEAVRLAPPPPPRVDPWRRTTGVHTVRSPRGLAVVQALWEAREELAQRVDRAPGRVLPDATIVAAAQALPADETALLDVPGFGGKGTRRRIGYWAEAVHHGLQRPEGELPPRRLRPNQDVPPPPRSWADKDPAAALRLDAVRTTVRALAEELELPQENLLAPAAQRGLAWRPPASTTAAHVSDALAALGARPWQTGLLAETLAQALHDATG